MDNMLLALAVFGAVVIVAVVVHYRSRATAKDATTHSSAAYFGPAEIEAYVREHATEFGRELFPDNPDVEWIVHGFTHTSEMILAEVEPKPDEAGYPRFKFGFIGGGARLPKCIATYCLDSGRYQLLSTARGAPGNLPRRLD